MPISTITPSSQMQYCNINSPQELKKYLIKQLPDIASCFRKNLIELVSQTGGHLGANLGTVELSIALHYVFNAPKDKIIWDVSHQCYVHKMLTGRRDQMLKLRQINGLAGFASRKESEFDCFGAGHSSTSISAGVGMALARDIKKNDNYVISIIGDGALSAGLAYEALNNTHKIQKPFIIILNDNGMSISPAIGCITNFLHKLNNNKNNNQKLLNIIQYNSDNKIINNNPINNNLFTDLGLDYIGLVDGHDTKQLVTVLNEAKNITKPLLIHVMTKKGHGYKPAELSDNKYHGVTQFDINSGQITKKTKDDKNKKTYSAVFVDKLIELAQQDSNIIAITAAMLLGTELDKFHKLFPDRCLDVGIAEQHAITCAAGMACEGIKPFVVIYSTFLQRAYDQIIHDVAVQNLPVRFAIDRAGYVGQDGATHQGMFDLCYLSCLPNMVVMAPADYYDMQDMIVTALHYNNGPISFRYPRDDVLVDTNYKGKIINIGQGKITKLGSNTNNLAIIGIGDIIKKCIIAANNLEEQGIACSVINMRFAKPIDQELLHKTAKQYKCLLFIEEGSAGGFSAHAINYLTNKGLMHDKIRIINMPDVFIEQASRQEQCDQGLLNVKGIINTAKQICNND